MIDVRGLTRRFDDVVAVDDVALAVAAGEIVGLVGVNGAGKTTLLRMMAGILQPTVGEIEIAGHRLVGDAVEARRSLAFVPDTPMLFDTLTVTEHLVFVARLYGVDEPEPKMDRLLEEFELVPHRHATAASLSRGMRQKLAICCAFLHDPPVLLLDEPLTGLDPPARHHMSHAIAARAEAGAAVIVSSHQLEFVERLSTRFVVIHTGQVRLAGTLDEIRAASGESTLEEVFLRAVRPDATGATEPR